MEITQKQLHCIWIYHVTGFSLKTSFYVHQTFFNQAYDFPKVVKWLGTEVFTFSFLAVSTSANIYFKISGKIKKALYTKIFILWFLLSFNYHEAYKSSNPLKLFKLTSIFPSHLIRFWDFDGDSVRYSGRGTWIEILIKNKY